MVVDAVVLYPDSALSVYMKRSGLLSVFLTVCMYTLELHF